MKKMFVIVLACLVASGLQAENVMFNNTDEKYLELQIVPKSQPNTILSVKLDPHAGQGVNIPGREIEQITFLEADSAQKLDEGKYSKIQVWHTSKPKQDKIMNMYGVSSYNISRGFKTLWDFKMEAID